MKKFMKKPSEFERKILSRYCVLEGRRANVQLCYDTFAELIDQNLGDNCVEKLNSSLFEKLSEIFSLLPKKYEAVISVQIKDFGSYTKEEAEKIIKDNFELLVYSLSLKYRRKWVKGLSLLGGGAMLLLMSYLLNRLDLPQILFDIINISGTLLVWESANVAIIERGEDVKRASQFVKKFKGIQIVSAKESEVQSQ